MRRSTKRARHLPTVAPVSFSRWAINRLVSPSALLRTIRARLPRDAGSKRLRVNDSQGVAGVATALEHALHPNLQLLVESSRAILRADHR